MNVLQLTSKMGPINFTPKIVKSLGIMQPTIRETYFIMDGQC